MFLQLPHRSTRRNRGTPVSADHAWGAGMGLLAKAGGDDQLPGLRRTRAISPKKDRVLALPGVTRSHRILAEGQFRGVAHPVVRLRLVMILAWAWLSSVDSERSIPRILPKFVRSLPVLQLDRAPVPGFHSE